MQDDQARGNNESPVAASGSVQAPSISMPKGGGAIRGIGEKFSVNPVTGTSGFTVPVYTSPGRSDFFPKLSLSYDSGAGNGPFGFGWHLSVPAITRKTDKGLPRYFDVEESDVFILSQAEDLVPVLTQAAGAEGQWKKITFSAELNNQGYNVHCYRPRIEGLFARIERWVNNSTGDTFWKSVSKDNVTSLYGVDLASRVADPVNPACVFTWLLTSTYDDRGNVVSYAYKPEDRANVAATPEEQNRQVTANRYLKRIFYGNRTPYNPITSSNLPSDWCFEVVFDYGEHGQANPTATEGTLWRCRPDAFSSYRSCFEVRTYRLCSRVLMFHHFEELGTPDYLVRSTDLTYSFDEQPANTLNPIYAFVESITQTGHVRTSDDTGYTSRSLPRLEFSYTQAEVDETIQLPDPASLENLPYGVDGSRYQWADLDSEGSPGIVSEQADGWFYKRNVSNLPGADGAVVARFEPLELVGAKPSSADLLGGSQQLMDLAGDGRLSLVQFSRPTPGFYEREDSGQWQSFRPFALSPNLDWKNPNLRTIDLNGDGFADILITENEVFTWYPSYAREGFGSAQTVRKPFDEDWGPALVFADGTQSIYTADMSGDGLSDMVRIRNGEVCYWPNLGYGRFGAKITMDGSPVFDSPDLFNQRQVRLADIDGSGTADIIYLGRDKITFWFNQSGNCWSSPNHLPQFAAADDLDSINVVDLLGNGTACLVWSSPLPGDTTRPMRYIDLMGGQKPHLLITIKNSLGAETQVQYSASTKFYLADRLAGQPWVTRLSFPVHVVERVETFDWVSRNLFVTCYTYHHGYYDGIEREFRGFGMVEQQDTEELGSLTATGDFPSATNIDAASYVPPILTKTWFHTGAYPMGGRVSRMFAEEYYRESDLAEGVVGLTDAEFDAMCLPDTVLPAGLFGGEIHEAIRSLKGSLLRQEIYALDGSVEADRPYSVSEKNYTIHFVQPFGGNRHAVFFTHARESIDFHYERKLYSTGDSQLADPRVTHDLVLAIDAYGNELQSVAVGYGRRRNSPNPLLTQADQLNQSTIHVTYTESCYTSSVDTADAHRTPLPAETSIFELVHVKPEGNLPDITNLFGFDEMASYVSQASDGNHDLPYQDIYDTGATTSSPYRRLLGNTRTLYRADNLSATLKLGAMESMALPYQTFKLAFTPGLLSDIYQGSVPNQTSASLAPILASGGYVLGDDLQSSGLFPASDPEGYWWIPSGRIFYSPGPSDNPGQELANALAQFFLPCRFEDPFGQNTIVTYDKENLLLLDTQDAAGNRVTAGARDASGNVTSDGNDYRVLQPALITDPNCNQTAADFDALGLVAATAVMGKVGQNIGDSLTGVSADLSRSQIEQFFSNPNNPSDTADPYITPSLLGDATARIVYDLHRFHTTQAANPNDPTQWKPAFAATIERETHVSDLASLPADQNGVSKLQISFSYSDGFGREIQKKLQAEPGPLDPNDSSSPIVDPRWVASGWTIFNNKGKPVRQYEPFFDDTNDFKFGNTVGVSPIVFYDPVGRVVATLHPDQSWEKVVFDPWHQESWDGNDTVLIPNASSPDPSLDVDVGVYFQRLPRADYFPTWYGQRINGGLTADDQDAAKKTTPDANTPTLAYFDTLGRTFLSVADNGLDQNNAPQKYCTRTELDIQGFQRSITDALNRKVMTYDYDMLGTKIHQNSVDAGERWMLNDVQGKQMLLWNSRGFQLQRDYDLLRRQIHLYVSQSGSSAQPQLAERNVYGETHPDSNPSSAGAPAPLTLNLRGKVYQQYDGGGVVTNNSYDFKGNLVSNTRQLLQDYQDQADWSSLESLLAVVPPATLNLASISTALLPLLEPTTPEISNTFTTSKTYDALNRPTTLTTPDGSVTTPAYNERRLLQAVSVALNISSATNPPPSVTDIEYNAKAQRDSITYGNNVITTYEYDPQTFRLVNLYTARPGATYPGDDPNPPNPPRGVQNLSYTYDPVGNITRIEDNAQQTVYFNNAVVTPINDYTYDPLYRLITALGRELIGQVSPPPTSWDDSSRMKQPVPGPNDGQAMRNYQEAYTYDPVGNFQTLVHSTATGNWTRRYAYDEPNSPPTNNHLTSTTAGGTKDVYGVPDADGNMAKMPQLAAMTWNFKDQLQMTQQQVVSDGSAPNTWYVYDSSGQRVCKVNQTSSGIKANQRIYLGGYEVYREYGPASAGTSGQPVTLERETLHMMDDKQRIALVETRTQGTDNSPVQLTRYQFSNHLESALLELDPSAAIISYEEYYPYGSTSYQAVSQSISPVAKRYRYTGKERDEESGFSYHGARYYAPWIGRWTSCDPTGMKDGLNVYTYVRNRPTSFVDSSGTQGMPGDLGYVARQRMQVPQRLRQDPTSQADHPIPQEALGKMSTPPGGSTTYKGGSDVTVLVPKQLHQAKTNAETADRLSRAPDEPIVYPREVEKSIVRMQNADYSPEWIGQGVAEQQGEHFKSSPLPQASQQLQEQGFSVSEPTIEEQNLPGTAATPAETIRVDNAPNYSPPTAGRTTEAERIGSNSRVADWRAQNSARTASPDAPPSGPSTDGVGGLAGAARLAPPLMLGIVIGLSISNAVNAPSGQKLEVLMRSAADIALSWTMPALMFAGLALNMNSAKPMNPNTVY